MKLLQPGGCESRDAPSKECHDAMRLVAEGFDGLPIGRQPSPLVHEARRQLEGALDHRPAATSDMSKRTRMKREKGNGRSATRPRPKPTVANAPQKTPGQHSSRGRSKSKGTGATMQPPPRQRSQNNENDAGGLQQRSPEGRRIGNTTLHHQHGIMGKDKVAAEKSRRSTTPSEKPPPRSVEQLPRPKHLQQQKTEAASSNRSQGISRRCPPQGASGVFPEAMTSAQRKMFQEIDQEFQDASRASNQAMKAAEDFLKQLNLEAGQTSPVHVTEPKPDPSPGPSFFLTQGEEKDECGPEQTQPGTLRTRVLLEQQFRTTEEGISFENFFGSSAAKLRGEVAVRTVRRPQSLLAQGVEIESVR